MKAPSASARPDRELVTAVVDDPHELRWLLAALSRAGFDGDAVQVLSGADGEHALDHRGSGHRLVSRFLRRVVALGLEYELIERLLEELQEGHAFVVVAANAGEVESIHEILLAHGAHFAHRIERSAAERLIA